MINAEKKELERRGHTVYVFSSAYPRSGEEKAKLARSHVYPVPTCRIFGRGATPIARRPAKIEKWLMKNHPELTNFDIFYVHYEAGCSIAGLRLGKRLNIPTVQVMHGREDMGEALIIPLGFRTLVAAALNLFHSWYLPHQTKIPKDSYQATTIARAKMWNIMVNHANAADFVITPSNYFRKMLVHYGVVKPIKALHHGIADHYTIEKVTPKTLAPGEPLKIIWHSRLCPEKRILPFLEALNILDESRTGSLKSTVAKLKNRELFAPPRYRYELDVYGDGTEAVAAKTYAKIHRLNVNFYGKTTFEHIWHELKTHHLDVLVSYNYDTFGMSLIEAESAGVPVLIADPDLEEIVPRGSYVLTKSPSPTTIAESLDALLAHPDKIANMSKTMLNHREDNKISTKITKLEEIFNDIIKS